MLSLHVLLKRTRQSQAVVRSIMPQFIADDHQQRRSSSDINMKRCFHAGGDGDCVQLPNNTMVLSLREHFGPRATISQQDVLQRTGAAGSKNIAVVRHAFLPHDGSPKKLQESLIMLTGSKAAVSAQLTLPEERLLVDEYEYDGHGSYLLKNIGTDLLRFLKGQGVDVNQVVDLNKAVGVASHLAKQSSNEVLMVAPTAFVFNDQAAQDNSFMNTNADGAVNESVTKTVLREFSNLYRVLTENARVKVNLFQHNLEHGTPDAVFPNNWFSTHAAGEANGGVGEPTLVYYPMKCPNRQAERRDDIKEILESSGYGKVVDLSKEEKQGKYFEGTGVLVLDRIRGTAFVALSERADKELAEKWVYELGYKKLVTFHSYDSHGSPVYHTNVMMAVGTSVAVACLESITDDVERKHFVSELSKTHEIVDITQQQMAALCGNVLELQDDRGLPVMAMSTRAYNAFTEEQKRTLRRHVAEIHHANIDTLEHIGGGGVRCTLAEIFH